jgi:hypothetical protein
MREKKRETNIQFTPSTSLFAPMKRHKSQTKRGTPSSAMCFEIILLKPLFSTWLGLGAAGLTIHLGQNACHHITRIKDKKKLVLEITSWVKVTSAISINYLSISMIFRQINLKTCYKPYAIVMKMVVS